MTSQAFPLKAGNVASQPKPTVPKAGTSEANDLQEEGTNEKSQLIASTDGAYCISITVEIFRYVLFANNNDF